MSAEDWTTPVQLSSLGKDYDQGFKDGCDESRRLNADFDVHSTSAYEDAREACAEIERSHAAPGDIIREMNDEIVDLRALVASQLLSIRAIKRTIQREYWDEYAGLDDTRKAIGKALAGEFEAENDRVECLEVDAARYQFLARDAESSLVRAYGSDWLAEVDKAIERESHP